MALPRVVRLLAEWCWGPLLAPLGAGDRLQWMAVDGAYPNVAAGRLPEARAQGNQDAAGQLEMQRAHAT